MADNVLIDPGSTTPIAADNIGGVLVQRVKINFGDDGSTSDASAANPLPVTFSGTMAVSAASLPLPTTAATSTKQSDGSQKNQIVDGSGNVIGSTSNALDINIKSGASSGAVTQGSTTSGETGS